MNRVSATPRAAWIVAAAAVVWGVVAALRHAWTCDDAFISFRYAENLNRGLGLVFNAGERVEGYSNFLWTLWCALGMRLGVDAERWAIGWGVACYAGAIALLVARWRDARRNGSDWAAPLPIAAVLAAALPDWNDFATSGLETSLFTLLALAAFVLLTGDTLRPGRAAAAGLVLGLAALTRPDGVVFLALAVAFVAWSARDWRPVAALVLAFAALAVPHLLWRLSYYHAALPNTWYAKSGGTPWYAQGWTYARLYFVRYWAVGLGMAAAAIAWLAALRSSADAGDDGARGRRELLLAALFAVGYTWAIVHVGGDFMFARMLIPATPFYLILTELGIARLASRRAVLAWGATALAAAAVAFSSAPVTAHRWIAGITDERAFYPDSLETVTRAQGLTLRRFFDGLPVRVAFLGGEARLVYFSRAPLALEAETGLTDAWIAHQTLPQRGRVGHEKRAPAAYVIGRRGAHFAFLPSAIERLDLGELIPIVPIDFDGVHGYVLRWDADLMPALEARGVRVLDFPRALDQLIAALDSLPDAEVRRDYLMNKRFYFNFVADPARETAFRARLSRATPQRAGR